MAILMNRKNKNMSFDFQNAVNKYTTIITFLIN